jgi:hypothetical protein
MDAAHAAIDLATADLLGKTVSNIGTARLKLCRPSVALLGQLWRAPFWASSGA